jgi:hypothetical protein
MHQMKLLMATNPNVDFHRWIFQSQVTPMNGNAYDVSAGLPADFCAYGKGVTFERGDLSDVVDKLVDCLPDVYRSGKLMTYDLNANLQRELVTVVKELSLP